MTPDTSKKIPDYHYAEDREITEIHLPDETEYIGKHAFYNCRSLERIYLPHGNIEIGDGAFKNCPRVSQITLAREDGCCSCLRDILYDMNQEVTVTVHYEEGDMAVLLFPHYEYEYIANEPARIFSEVGYGAGYLYQQCFFNSRIDYGRYDKLWKSARVSEDISVLSKILSGRLRFPHALSSEAENEYLRYWQEHTEKLLTCFMKRADMDSIRFFLEGATESEELTALAKKIALSLQIPELVSYLLDLENRTRPAHGAAGKFRL